MCFLLMLVLLGVSFVIFLLLVDGVGFGSWDWLQMVELGI